VPNSSDSPTAHNEAQRLMTRTGLRGQISAARTVPVASTSRCCSLGLIRKCRSVEGFVDLADVRSCINVSGL
jgi:hypothetical protein